MTETAPDTSGQEQTTIYTAYEIDFMLNLRPTAGGSITRDQVGLRSAPEAAQEFVTAAVTSGLRARGKVQHSEDGQWLLGEEGVLSVSPVSRQDVAQAVAALWNEGVSRAPGA